MHWRPLLMGLIVAGATDAAGQFRDTLAADRPLRPTPLADAAEARDWPAVVRLLQSGAEVDAAQADGMTALHWAAYRDHAETVRQLIAAGADVKAKTRYHITPLTIACTIGNLDVVRPLVEAGADVNHELAGGETPLLLAARTGDAGCVRKLLEHGAKIDARECGGQTALMWAAAEGNVEAVDALIKAGAELTASTDTGFTAMMFAAREGHAAVVDRLLRAGVDVNAAMSPKQQGGRVPRKGTSALILAVESGHFELAMSLVEAGADPNDQRSGYTPLHMLSWVRKPDRGENPMGDPPPRGSGKLTGLQFVRALAKAGADVNAKLKQGNGGRAVLNPRGATPLLLAAKTADVPLMKTLIELGADPSLTNVDQCTPLMAAAGIGVRAVGEEAGTESEVIEAVDYLIGLGADVNAVDKNGETAMHGAAYRNFPLVVKRLAEHGADADIWNRKNRYGWTPVMIAQGHRPGSFKPSPETVGALQAAMNHVTPRR